MVGGADETGLVARGAGERAPDVAEQLALEERGGDASAVDGDERAGAAGQGVDGAGQDLLAGARFAEEQHRDGQPRDAIERGVLLGEARDEGGEAGRQRGERGAVEVGPAGEAVVPGQRQRGAVDEERGPDLEEITIAQRGAGDALSVDEGAVLGALVDDRPAGLAAFEACVDRRDGAAGEPEIEPAAGTVQRSPGGALGAAAHDDDLQLGEVVAAAPRERPVAVKHDEEVGPGRHRGAVLARVGVLGAGGRGGHAALALSSPFGRRPRHLRGAARPVVGRRRRRRGVGPYCARVELPHRLPRQGQLPFRFRSLFP